MVYCRQKTLCHKAFASLAFGFRILFIALYRQSELFDCPVSSKYRNLGDTIKQLRDKFGDAIITRAGTRIVGNDC